jgi:hypothetical protein
LQIVVVEEGKPQKKPTRSSNRPPPQPTRPKPARSSRSKSTGGKAAAGADNADDDDLDELALLTAQLAARDRELERLYVRQSCCFFCRPTARSQAFDPRYCREPELTHSIDPSSRRRRRRRSSLPLRRRARATHLQPSPRRHRRRHRWAPGQPSGSRSSPVSRRARPRTGPKSSPSTCPGRPGSRLTSGASTHTQRSPSWPSQVSSTSGPRPNISLIPPSTSPAAKAGRGRRTLPLGSQMLSLAATSSTQLG